MAIVVKLDDLLHERVYPWVLTIEQSSPEQQRSLRGFLQRSDPSYGFIS
jgi:hypothetical protein